MVRILKIFLAILLLACLFDMPYGYYQFIRFLSFIFFLVFAYDSFSSGKNIISFLWLALALLFQPFAKIALGRELWNIIDIIVSIVLIISLFIPNNQIKKQSDEK